MRKEKTVVARWRILIWGVVVILVSTVPVSPFSSLASTPSVVTERWGANATAEYASDLRDATLNGLHPTWPGGTGDELSIRSGGGFDAWAVLYFDVQNGVSPDPSYDGTTDATITTWGNNSYANCGGWGYLQVGETDSADQFRFLVRFDLDGWLAADAQIEGAWLELRAFDSGYDDRPHDVVAHRVIEEWVEGDGWNLSADGRDEGVTWVTARPGVDWATPGGDFDPVELDRVTVAADPDGWHRWDVTAAVRAWADGTAPNYGLLLEPDSGPWLHHQFRSSEYDDPALRPRLVINLQTACPTDVTGDRSVDLSDVMAVTTRWHRPDLYDPDFDLNGDGGIDVLDIMVVVTRWGLPCGVATSTATMTATATPTPTPTATPTTGPTATPTTTQVPGTLDVPLTVTDHAGVTRVSDPVTSGVPLPRAANVTDVAQLQLTDADGQSVAAQFTALARWGGAPDDATKPIKWVLVDFQADVGPMDNSPCDLSCGPGYAHNNPGEGDGRGPAYALETLTDAYAATGNPVYLTSAQRVVAASHPDNTWFGQPGFTLDPDVSPSGRQTSPWSLGCDMRWRAANLPRPRRRRRWPRRRHSYGDYNGYPEGQPHTLRLLPALRGLSVISIKGEQGVQVAHVYNVHLWGPESATGYTRSLALRSGRRIQRRS